VTPPFVAGQHVTASPAALPELGYCPNRDMSPGSMATWSAAVCLEAGDSRLGYSMGRVPCSWTRTGVKVPRRGRTRRSRRWGRQADDDHIADRHSPEGSAV